MKNLVIVESPSKSKTIEKYLGSDFEVVSSKGHIRDLATKGKEGLGVDVENDFAPTYSISKEKAAVVKELKAKGYEIIATRDTHFDEKNEDVSKHYMNTQEGKNLPVPHCISDTKGWEIADSVKAAMGDVKVFDKYTFGSEELAHYMKSVQPEEIELLGLCTDICVVSNALLMKANFLETKVSVDASCCAGVTVDSHNAALATMKMCQVNVIRE